jgi:hypothetical protein
VWSDNSVRTPSLENILVDPLTRVWANAQLDPKVAMDLKPTESCQLDPAEDSLLEIGKKNPMSRWKFPNGMLVIYSLIPKFCLNLLQACVSWHKGSPRHGLN